MNKQDQLEIDECERIVKEWEARELEAMMARRRSDERVYRFGAGVILIATIGFLCFLMFRGHP